MVTIIIIITMISIIIVITIIITITILIIRILILLIIVPAVLLLIILKLHAWRASLLADTWNTHRPKLTDEDHAAMKALGGL